MKIKKKEGGGAMFSRRNKMYLREPFFVLSGLCQFVMGLELKARYIIKFDSGCLQSVDCGF
jgi:hypothetical protein